MGLELISYVRDGVDLIERDLAAILEAGKAGEKDFVALTAAIDAWAETGFSYTRFSFVPIETYDKKLWEARYLKSARRHVDGVHGYRIFYIRERRPSTNQQAVVLLKIWGKAGDHTPDHVFSEAWDLAMEVRDLIKRGRFFREPDGRGIH